MKESFWAYFTVIFGLIIVIIMLFINRMTSTTEEDFYLAREIMQSSMIDAVDYGAYRSTGRLVISKQKFMEVFIRRFAESVTNNKTYQISFYDIYEEPPKATVRIRTTAGASVDSETFDVTLDTVQSGILETIYGMNSYAEYTLVYDSMGGSTCSPSSKTVEKGKAWGALCVPTKADNTFKGWNTEKDGSGTTITEKSIATNSLVIYAQWDTLQYNGKPSCELVIEGSNVKLVATGAAEYGLYHMIPTERKIISKYDLEPVYNNDTSLEIVGKYYNNKTSFGEIFIGYVKNSYGEASCQMRVSLPIARYTCSTNVNGTSENGVGLCSNGENSKKTCPSGFSGPCVTGNICYTFIEKYEEYDSKYCEKVKTSRPLTEFWNDNKSAFYYKCYKGDTKFGTFYGTKDSKNSDINNRGFCVISE